VELYLHSHNTPSWHGDQLRHRDNFASCFTSATTSRILMKFGIGIMQLKLLSGFTFGLYLSLIIPAFHESEM
jgi:hypothetical protein